MVELFIQNIKNRQKTNYLTMLLLNLHIKKTRERGRQGKRIEKIFKNVWKIAKSPIAKELGEITIENAPKVYKKAVSKVKNKLRNKALNSDIFNSILGMRKSYAYDKIK